MTEPVSLVTKVSMMLVSLVLSFGLWVYVQYVQPEGSQYGTVPIAAQNTEAFSSRYIFPDLGDAYVRIEGPQDQLKDDAAVKRVLRENRVFVWVDFKTAQQGTRMYPVNIVSSHESPFTFSLANKTVRVDIEATLTRRTPVNMESTGETPRKLNAAPEGTSTKHRS